MPARVMPSNSSTPSYMNPVSAPDDASASKKRQQTSELTVCISLASLFDFEKTGHITQENWQKGMTTLMMEELGMDPKVWERLVGMHGSKDAGKGRLDVQRLTDVVPIDPRVSVLLNAIVKGLVGMRDFIGRTLKKENKEQDLKLNRALLNIRRRITLPVMTAWRDLTRENRRIFRKAGFHMRNNAYSKAWRSWVDNVADIKYEQRAKRAEERKMRRVRQHAMRMKNAKVVGCWNSWLEMWHERKKFVKAMSRLKNRGLSMAFNSWIEMREQGLMLRRMARRAKNRDLLKGWNSWFDFLDGMEEEARQKRVMAAVVHRYLNKGVSAALNKWTAEWRELQRQKNLLRRAAHPCSSAWRQWMAVAEMNAYLKGTMGRFANNAVSKAWNRWMEALEERYAMRRFVKRMINSGMARAFSEWLSMADQAKHDARQLKKFGTRMMRVKEVQCFNKMCARSRAMAHAMAHARSSGAALAHGTCFLPLASTVVSCAPSSCTPPPTALPLAPPHSCAQVRPGAGGSEAAQLRAANGQQRPWQGLQHVDRVYRRSESAARYHGPRSQRASAQGVQPVAGGARGDRQDARRAGSCGRRPRFEGLQPMG